MWSRDIGNRDVGCCSAHLPAHDAEAERSKAVAQGAIPKGRGFEPHSCQFVTRSEMNTTFKYMASSLMPLTFRPAAFELLLFMNFPSGAKRQVLLCESAL